MHNAMLLANLIAACGPSDSFGHYGEDYFGAPMALHFSPDQLAAIRRAQGAHPALVASRAQPPARNTGGTALHFPGLASLAHGGAMGGGAVAPRPMGRATTDAVYWGVDTGSVLIAAGASATITVRPQQRCVPISLSLVEPVAENFLISSILVGVMPILVTTGAISPAIFVQNSTAPTFKRYMLEVGTDFSVSVTNITAATPARFSATAIGENHAADAC